MGNELQETSCKYCRGEDHADSTLLYVAMQLLEMSREELIAKVKEI